MKSPSVVVIDAPRDFRTDEMFFSTTDRRGVITAGNEVFVRISGYDLDELVGHAHNLIRHPDMPQAAFRLVWRYLLASRRTAALVKNLAKDGRYYWVVALFVPTPDGFLSIRFKPTSPLVDGLRQIYAQMRAEEVRLKEQGADDTAAMDAATAILNDAVRARGFADYDTFMRVLLCDELKSRDAVLARENRAILQPLPDASGAPAEGARAREELRGLYAQGAEAYSRLSRLHLRLDEFIALQNTLEGKSRFVDGLTRELRLAAMNVALASGRLGDQGQGLGVISRYMGTSSGDVGTAVNALTTGIQGVSARLRSVIFNLAAGRLQIEMILIFVRELLAVDLPPERLSAQHRLIRTLQFVFRHSLGRAVEALANLDGSARTLNTTSRDIQRHMLGLQVARLGGTVETTRLSQQDAFSTVFGHIRRQIDDTQTQLGELGEALESLDLLARETPLTAREIDTAAAQMENDVARFLAA